MKPSTRRAAAAALVLCLSAAPAGPSGGPSAAERAGRPFGDARVLAQVPEPGFPEGIVVLGNRVYVAGPATFGTTGGPPSYVVSFDLDGGDRVTYPVRGEDTNLEHANSSIAVDGAGRLYVLNTQLGVYRLSLPGGAQEQWSLPFPDLPPCWRAPAGPCSPTAQDAPPIPNDLVFASNGDAYVTDSLQATIWRVPAAPDVAGQRLPEVWFQDARLASPYIGVNGLRLDPEREHLYLTVSTDLHGRALVYTLPFTGSPARSPRADELQPFFEYRPGELPDGIAFGRSGRLYVALAGPHVSGVSVLRRVRDADGSRRGEEVARLGNPVGEPVHPYDSPANIAFTSRGSILLTNHAIATGAARPEQFTVLDVYVGDKGVPLVKPSLP